MAKPTRERRLGRVSSTLAGALPLLLASCPAPRVASPHAEVPPAALRALDGRVIRAAREWPARRHELAQLFAEHVYGKVPAAPRPTFRVVAVRQGALGGRATRKEIDVRIARGGNAVTFQLLLYTPAGSGPVPAFLGLNFLGNHTVTRERDVRLARGWVPKRGKGVVNHRATDAGRGTSAARWPIAETVAAGFAVCTLYHGDIDPDHADDRNGVQALLYRAGQTRPEANEWGTLAAWAWGLSRALDYLETDPDVDAARVAVFGHSRNGKAALLAGARDERFALVISNQSGCGGAALSRRRRGETVDRINRVFPHWFCRNFRRYDGREDDLPVDQHLLVALCAPRPVLVCSAAADSWADPEGEFLALTGADPVYRLLGAGGIDVTEMPAPNELVATRLGYHVRPGRHGIGAADWAVFRRYARAQLPSAR